MFSLIKKKPFFAAFITPEIFILNWKDRMQNAIDWDKEKTKKYLKFNEHVS